MEPLEIDDIDFYPCKCEYQVYSFLLLSFCSLFFHFLFFHFSQADANISVFLWADQIDFRGEIYMTTVQSMR